MPFLCFPLVGLFVELLCWSSPTIGRFRLLTRELGGRNCLNTSWRAREPGPFWWEKRQQATFYKYGFDVVAAETSFQMLEALSFCDLERANFLEKKVQLNFTVCFFFFFLRGHEKTKSNHVLLVLKTPM